MTFFVTLCIILKQWRANLSNNSSVTIHSFNKTGFYSRGTVYRCTIDRGTVYQFETITSLMLKRISGGTTFFWRKFLFFTCKLNMIYFSHSWIFCLVNLYLAWQFLSKQVTAAVDPRVEFPVSYLVVIVGTLQLLFFSDKKKGLFTSIIWSFSTSGCDAFFFWSIVLEICLINAILHQIQKNKQVTQSFNLTYLGLYKSASSYLIFLGTQFYFYT